MKIGILTFHCAHNYGAVLQAYGLQEYLRSQGHETYIIDYRPGYLTRNYKAFNIRFWMASTPREIVYKLRYEPFYGNTEYCGAKHSTDSYGTASTCIPMSGIRIFPISMRFF